MNRPTISFYLRVEKDRIGSDKSCKVYMRITLDNVQQPRFSTGISIPIRKEFQHMSEEEILSFPTEKLDEKSVTRYDLYHWDNAKGQATKGCGNMQEKNRNLDRAKERANKALDELELMGKPVTPSNFAHAFKTPNQKLSFYDYCYNVLFGSRDHTLKEHTLKTYDAVMSKMDNYCPGVRMKDIDVKFLTEYQNWMLKPKELDENGKNIGGAGNIKRTAANNLKVIRTMFRMAIKNGDFPERHYPFKDFKITGKDRKLTTRDFLEIEEIYELEKLYHAYYPPSLENYKLVSHAEWDKREKGGIVTPGEFRVLERFLLSCYTGLRFTDTEALDRDLHVFSRGIKQKNSEERVQRYYIEMAMHKTDEPVTIPLIDKAIAILKPEQGGKVFIRISNQKCNKFLKSIQRKAGIEKKLSFHVSRHSFATVAFEYEINERVVQEVLGHLNRASTEIYAHLTKRRVFLEMEKLNTAHKGFMPGKEALEKMDEGKLAKILPLLKNMDGEKLEKLVGLLEVMAAA